MLQRLRQDKPWLKKSSPFDKVRPRWHRFRGLFADPIRQKWRAKSKKLEAQSLALHMFYNSNMRAPMQANWRLFSPQQEPLFIWEINHFSLLPVRPCRAGVKLLPLLLLELPLCRFLLGYNCTFSPLVCALWPAVYCRRLADDALISDHATGLLARRCGRSEVEAGNTYCVPASFRLFVKFMGFGKREKAVAFPMII